MRKLNIPALAVSWLLILSPAAHAFDIIQITNNSTNDYSPGISGSNAVWANEADGDFEVYLWDGATITQITNNSIDDEHPAISGSNVVWWGGSGLDA